MLPRTPSALRLNKTIRTTDDPMILFAFLGLWAALATGVGAISIPVIIHLINRRRFKIVPWAAMKFLLAAQKQTRKRMRVEQLMLLLVRMAVMAMVLFAMISV